MNRALGENVISTELVMGGDRNIYLFILSVWEKELMPEEWNTAIICPIFLKGNMLECENY
jgi:hypothetical protein